MTNRKKFEICKKTLGTDCMYEVTKAIAEQGHLESRIGYSVTYTRPEFIEECTSLLGGFSASGNYLERCGLDVCLLVIKRMIAASEEIR